MNNNEDGDLFTLMEREMKTKFPVCLKNLLKAAGYDNQFVLSQINEKEILNIENFARTELHALISDKNIESYYGKLYSGNPKKFRIVEGHKALIFGMRSYLNSDLENNKENSSEISKAMVDKATNTENIDEQINSQEIHIMPGIANMNEENKIIYKNLKKWTKNKYGNEEWKKNDMELEFDNLIFNIRKVGNQLKCKIQCFCKELISIAQSTREGGKQRWIYSNFHTHFNNKHLSNTASKTIPQEVSSLDSSQQRITNFFMKPHNNIKIIENLILKPGENEINSCNFDCQVQSNCEILELGETSTNTKEKLMPKRTKWSSLKYSRKERIKRHIEKQSTDQKLITDFCPIIDKINEILENNPELHTDVRNKFKNVYPNLEIELTSSNDSSSRLLQILCKTAVDNSSSKSNNFEEEFKKFSLYLFYLGGKRLYETLQLNLKNILPSLSTLHRFRQKNLMTLEEGQFDFKGLSQYLEQRNLPKIVWISEDGTRIISKIEYNQRTNKVMGFVMPLVSGYPDTNAFSATSAQKIQEYFEKSPRADYAYVMMAQPLCPKSPPFCVFLVGTDNKFTYKDVVLRWKKMQLEAEKYGIRILGYSSDGDTRLLKAMKVQTGFSDHQEGTWYHINLKEDGFAFVQDTVHVITKLKTRLLKPDIILPMGNFFVQKDHLLYMIQKFEKDKHWLSKSDLISEDKMNFESARKMCSDRALICLKKIDNSAGTVQYLKLMKHIINSFIDKSRTLEQRVFEMCYVVSFFRLWKKWIIEHSDFGLTDNFITLNTFTCIEINGQMLIKLIRMFQTDSQLTPDMFLPWILGSQQCESLFRSARSMTSTFSTVINFTMKQFLQKVERITFINFVLYDLRNAFNFERENTEKHRNEFNTVTEMELNNIDLDKIIKDSLLKAHADAIELGMIVDIEAGYQLYLKVEGDQQDQFDVNHETEADFIAILDDTENEKTFREQDQILEEISQGTEDEGSLGNVLDRDLDLKDYSLNNVDCSESGPFLKITLPGEKTIVIRKSSLCWLLEEGRGRVSTDRIRRFYGNTKKKNISEKYKENKKRTASKRVKKNNMNNKENTSTEESSENDEIFSELFNDDSSDNNCFSGELGKEESESNDKCISIMNERYYAVFYDENYFIGYVLSQNNNKITLRFLNEKMNEFYWPKREDIQTIDKEFIFYGPLDLLGAHPFKIKRSDRIKIVKQYRDMKDRVK